MADDDLRGDARKGPSGGGRAPTPRSPGTFKVGTIAGSDVLVSSSWFLVAGLIAVVMAPRVEEVSPGLGALKYVAGLAFAVVLYLSVLLHEASHAIVAKRYGFPVTSITLHFLGGMTAIEGEARKPREEFWIAVVGPLTSLAVGGAAVLGLWGLALEGLLLMALQGLAGANLIVGVLNLIPGLPLDGGRVLKAVVWGATGDVHRGTIVAGWGGRLTACAVMLWPLLQEQWFGPPDFLDLIFAFVIAMFLWSGATAAMTSARLRRKVPGLVARDLARRTLTVPADLPLSEAVRRAQEAHAGSIVTVTGSGSPVGVVNEAALLATPDERRPWVAVSAVARTLEAGLSLPATITGEDLILAISRQPAAEYLLLEDDGSIYGVLSTADVDQAFRESTR
ncbi:site-2 protease family protein [Nocardioides sp.]|uniref:site-2 protease family protein n=1 Tax=Nocardioides sp. TaxID=35761 RepID=UPI0031FE549B|nr:peptidase [Nocardioides sp.]